MQNMGIASSAQGVSVGSQMEERHMEFRIPHILLVGLFYSVLMMIVAENMLP